VNLNISKVRKQATNQETKQRKNKSKYGQQRSYYLEQKTKIYKTQQKSLMLVNNALIVVT
jgi:hypothetical protein